MRRCSLAHLGRLLRAPPDLAHGRRGPAGQVLAGLLETLFEKRGMTLGNDFMRICMLLRGAISPSRLAALPLPHLLRVVGDLLEGVALLGLLLDSLR
jgi:hypothetical protein